MFHVIGLKCQECGSYNTCRTADPTGAKQVEASSGATGVGHTTSNSSESENTTNDIPPEGSDG